MNEAQAISLVQEWILWRGLDYPTAELVADRFEAGWSVYAPVEIDESDPMAFLDIPVGRAVFLVGDSGRIEETSSSVPPGVAEAEFTAQERAAQLVDNEIEEAESAAELDREFATTAPEEPSTISDFTITGTGPEEGTLDLGGDK